MNKRNCHVTRRISVGLKTVERCVIDKICLIQYNQMRLRVRVPELMQNEKKIDV